jgi:hypothetical protein
MGRFKSNDAKANLSAKGLIDLINNNHPNENQSISIDWTQLLSPYRSQNNASTLQLLMNKVILGGLFESCTIFK